MIKRIAVLLLILTGLVLLGNLLFFWANSIADSYFYWAISEYIRTGTYPFTYPFIYAKPTTISPPLYGVLLLIIGYLPWPALFLRLIQTILLCSTGYFTYRILTKFFTSYVAVIISCVSVLIPANIIYTNYMLTENIAQWFVAVIAYLLVKRSKQSVALALLVSSIALLAKYSLIVYAAVSGIMFLFSRPRRHLWIYPVLAACIIAGWICINWNITGTVGLSDSNGIQLYNQIVWIGQTLPDEQSAAMKELRRYVPTSVPLKRGYWDIQEYILEKTNRQWRMADMILGNVAREAVKEHPIQYIGTTARIFLDLHGRAAPYWSNLGTFGKPQGAYPLYCGYLGTFKMCDAPVPIQGIQSVWNAFVSWSDFFYRMIFPVLTFGIFFPSLLIGCIGKNTSFRLLCLLYLVGVIPIAMYVHPDPRYIIPFYPLMVSIMAKGVLTVFRGYKQALAGIRPKE
jgi:hypothetical protein